jgi:UrcA family protein
MNFHRTPALVAAAMLAALTLAGTASLAHADTPSASEKQIVRYGDLNLATQAGLQALYRRIENAAADVCGPSTVTGSRIVSTAWKDCVGSAVRNAVLKVNHPSLTAYYAVQLRSGPLKITG